MADSSPSRWPGWSWWPWFSRLQRLWTEPPAMEQAPPVRAAPVEPQLAASGACRPAHARDETAPDRAAAPPNDGCPRPRPDDFTVAEWQRLNYLRWRYLHNRLSEFPDGPGA